MTGEIWLLHIAVLAMLVAVSFILLGMTRMLSAIFMFSIFSLLMSLMYLLLDSPDVAMTEASVGAGVSTIFMVAALSGISRHEIRLGKPKPFCLLATLSCLCVILYAFSGLPLPGSPENPANQHLSVYYIENAKLETGVPNAVTAILASYRGYDTLGELFVIFTAFLGVAYVGSKRDA